MNDKEYKKINISFFGGSGLFSKRESPLIAEIISCCESDNCDLYKEGKCLHITRPFGCLCKYGKKERIKGYTRKARKYSDFRKKYENDKNFDNLDSCYGCKIAKIGNDIFFGLAFININENNKVCNPSFFENNANKFIPINEVNNALLHEICTFKPRNVLEGKYIKQYQEEQIPEFLYQMKKRLPKMYQDFINEYPEIEKILPNHIGKKAKIITLNKGCYIEDCHKNKFLFDGENLINENYKSCFLWDKAEAYVKIKVSDNMTCKITDNNQVNENTIFVK